MNPLVSIIIPTYNRAHLIGETLDSVLAQTYSNWECIIVDDGSTDDTEKVVQEYQKNDIRFHYLKRPNDRPKGANACRNYGFELSRGKYINWFDDDDVMLVNFLQEKMTVFDEKLKIVICSGFFVNEKLNNPIEINLDESANLFVDYLMWNLKILTPSILFKRSFLINKELFSDKIKRGQETELFSRLFFNMPQKEYKIISKYTFYYRQHTATKSFRGENTYIKEYVNSRVFIFFENLERAQILKSEVLINTLKNNLVYYFFRGLDNKDYIFSKQIMNKLGHYLYKKNFLFIFQLMFFGNTLLLLKRGSYTIERKLIKMKVK